LGEEYRSWRSSLWQSQTCTRNEKCWIETPEKSLIEC
jgi:hypothetical protein